MVIGDAEKPHLKGCSRLPDEADIRGLAGLARMLERRTGKSALADGSGARIEQDVGGWGAADHHIGFDIAGANLEVPDLAIADHNAARMIIGDVGIRDIDLMKIQFFQQNSDAGIMVNINLRDQDVAVAAGQDDAVAEAMEKQAAEDAVERSLDADAVGVGVGAGDGEAIKQRGALALGDLGGDRLRVSCAAMRTFEGKSGPWAGHDEGGRAVAAEPARPDAGEIDHDGSGNPVVTSGQENRSCAGVDGSLDCGGVVGVAITARTMIMDGMSFAR